MRWDLIWDCTRRQGQSIRGVGLACGGSGRSNRGWKDGSLQLLHSFNEPLLGYFPATSGSSRFRYQLGFVGGVKESLVQVSMWVVSAWAGQTEVGNMVACKFFTAPMGGFSLLFWRRHASSVGWRSTGRQRVV